VTLVEANLRQRGESYLIKTAHPNELLWRLQAGRIGPHCRTGLHRLLNFIRCLLLLETGVRFGSWLCENAKTLDRDRRSYSSKTALGLQFASAFNLEIKLENVILVAFRLFAFLHSQGHKPTRRRNGGDFRFATDNGQRDIGPTNRLRAKRRQRTFGPQSQPLHRLILNSANSVECFRNMAIRLLVNSAMTLGNSRGDLIIASL